MAHSHNHAYSGPRLGITFSKSAGFGMAAPQTDMATHAFKCGACVHACICVNMSANAWEIGAHVCVFRCMQYVCGLHMYVQICI